MLEGGGTQNIKKQLIVWQFGSSFLVSCVKPMERSVVLLVYGAIWSHLSVEEKQVTGSELN